MADVKIEGLGNVLDRFRQLSFLARGEIVEQAALAAARVIRDEAERLAPRGTEPVLPGRGRLAKNIAVQLVKEDLIGSTVEVIIAPRRRVFHAMFIEFGTSRQSARPFMRPAIDAKGDEAIRTFAAHVKKLID